MGAIAAMGEKANARAPNYSLSAPNPAQVRRTPRKRDKKPAAEQANEIGGIGTVNSYD